MPDIVGLTIQQRTVRGVEAKISRRGNCTVLRTGEVPVDPGAFESGRLVDASAFAECLRELWSHSGFRSKRVQLVIDGRLAVVRRTELPSLDSAQLRKAASYDIAELLNYPIAEAVFDVDEIEQFDRNGTTWARALVVAVEESTLTDLGAAVTAAGLKLVGTDLAAESLARGVAYRPVGTDDSGADAADQPIAILDCEDATTNIVIRDRSGVLFARTLGVGVGESMISMADELESALAQLSGDDGSLGGAQSSSAGVSAVVESIRRTLSYYNAELDDRVISRVSVAGARGQAPGLLAALQHTLDVPAEVSETVATWPSGTPVPGYETPIGAAIGAVESNTRHLVLTSDRERATRARRRNQAAALASGLPVMVFLIGAAFGVRADVDAARATADQSEAAADALALRLSDLEASSQRIAEWEAAVSDVVTIEDQQVRLDLVVRELGLHMPADTRILNIDLQRGVLGELPPGYDGPAPAGLVTITGIADDLDGVSRWLAGASASETIDGLWLEQSSFGPIGTNGETGALFSAKGVITDSARPTESIISGRSHNSADPGDEDQS